MKELRLGLGPSAHGPERRSGRAELAELVSRRLRVRVTVSASQNYSRLLRAAEEGEVDVAWLPPAIMVIVTERIEGSRLLLGSERTTPGQYHGALVLRPDSPIEMLADLRDKTVAWVDRASCGGFLFPRFALAERGIDPNDLFAEERFLRSHAEVARAVSEGRVDVGAVYANLAPASSERAPNILHTGYTDVDPTLRCLLLSRPIPVDTITAMRTLSDEIREPMVAMLKALHESDSGQIILRDLMQAKRLIPADLKSYDVVRAALNVAALPRWK